MPTVGKSVWTHGRKVMGNLVPGLLSFPFAIAGVLQWRPEAPLAPGPLLLLAAFPVAGWFALCFFGLWSNRAMRDELGRRFGRDHGRPETNLVFVGFARPGFRSVLDPHEDVGFLMLLPDRVEIYGNQIQWSASKAEVQAIRLASNSHSLLGLGGWIVLETPSGALKMEPRQRDTLIGNRLFRKELLAQLQAWRNENEIPVKKT